MHFYLFKAQTRALDVARMVLTAQKNASVIQCASTMKAVVWILTWNVDLRVSTENNKPIHTLNVFICQ